MDRRKFVAGAVALTASSTLARPLSAAKQIGKKQPNLLFIMPDEFRLQALGFWQKPEFKNALRTVSDPVHTPVLDRLAAESRVFTQACATAPVCSPSRAMFMSGMYPSQNGVISNCHEGKPDGMHDDIVCLTDVLAEAGYETGYVGKTHWEETQPLFDAEGNYVGTETAPGGHYANPFDTYIPPGKGRHSNRYWFQDIRDQHFNALSYSSVPALVDGKKDGQPYRWHEFTPKLEADAVIGFLKNTAGQRDANKPFSMIWAPNPPHMPYYRPEDCEQDIYKKYYADMPVSELLNRPNVDAEKAAADTRHDPRKCASIYFSNVTGVDQQIGRVLQALEESGEAENTIVVFTADHGEMMGSHGRMAKSVIYDESFLVPFMIRYPEHVKPGVEDLLLGRVDVMPTLLGMMGLESKTPETVRGMDYSGTLLGSGRAQAKPKSAAYLMDLGRGVRSDRYTYFVSAKGETELFDNVADPYQMKNLSLTAIPPADLHTLQAELGQWLKTAQDPWYTHGQYKELITYPG